MASSSRREFLRRGARAASLATSAGLIAGGAAPAEAVEPPTRTGGPRLKVGCAAYSYRKYLQAKTDPITLADFLDDCARWNLDGVELTSYYFPPDLTAATIHRLTRRAFLLGLEIAGTAVGNRFCLPPGAERQKEIENLKRWIGYAADMGARSIRIFAGSLPKEAQGDEATGRKWVIECLEECLPTAEAKGVILALENHGGIVSDAEGVLAILNAFRSDWLGAKWDSGNFRTADPFADLKRTLPYAVTTHVKTEYAPGGKKQPADLQRIVSLLRGANYRGYLLLEYEAEEEPKTAVPRTLAELQRLAARS